MPISWWFVILGGIVTIKKAAIEHDCLVMCVDLHLQCNILLYVNSVLIYRRLAQWTNLLHVTTLEGQIMLTPARSTYVHTTYHYQVFIGRGGRVHLYPFLALSPCRFQWYEIVWALLRTTVADCRSARPVFP